MDQQELPKAELRLLSAGHLFGVAKAAFHSIRTDVPDDTPGQQQSLVAIVFSAVTIEAFINEVAEVARDPWLPSETPDPQSVTDMADVLAEVEEGRGSTLLKYRLAMRILTRAAYPRGQQPYQDLQLLMRVRDALLHHRPEIAEFEFGGKPEDSPIVRALRSRGIVARFDVATVAGWVSLVETRAAARWACNAASQAVSTLMDAIPPGKTRGELTQLSTLNPFQPLP